MDFSTSNRFELHIAGEEGEKREKKKTEREASPWTERDVSASTGKKSSCGSFLLCSMFRWGEKRKKKKGGERERACGRKRRGRDALP